MIWVKTVVDDFLLFSFLCRLLLLVHYLSLSGIISYYPLSKRCEKKESQGKRPRRNPKLSTYLKYIKRTLVIISSDR